ncbi:hypothetical protein ACFRCG_13100 [Embleya sp. NPDC056575]|uniref:hypothetical protein n=1 Tax=unclassified Embleya TaxID=2699296 RepID=UPI00368908DD
MTRQHTPTALALLTALVLILVTACGGDSDRIGVEVDGKAHDRLAAGIKDLGEHGREGTLRDLTPFAWDNVWVFFEGASKKDIESATGDRVALPTGTISGGGDRYYGTGPLFVFTRAKHPARAIAVPYGGITEAGGPWPPTTRLIPGTPGAAGSLSLQR